MKHNSIWECFQSLKTNQKKSDKAIIKGLRFKCCDEDRWGVTSSRPTVSCKSSYKYTMSFQREVLSGAGPSTVMSLIQFHKAEMARWTHLLAMTWGRVRFITSNLLPWAWRTEVFFLYTVVLDKDVSTSINRQMERLSGRESPQMLEAEVFSGQNKGYNRCGRSTDIRKMILFFGEKTNEPLWKVNKPLTFV